MTLFCIERSWKHVWEIDTVDTVYFLRGCTTLPTHCAVSRLWFPEVKRQWHDSVKGVKNQKKLYLFAHLSSLLFTLLYSTVLRSPRSGNSTRFIWGTFKSKPKMGSIGHTLSWGGGCLSRRKSFSLNGIICIIKSKMHTFLHNQRTLFSYSLFLIKISLPPPLWIMYGIGAERCSKRSVFL